MISTNLVVSANEIFLCDLYGHILNKLTQQLIFVSDIHLFEDDDNLGLALLNLIERIDPNSVEFFVLGGDIFDFCFGASSFFKEKFSRIGLALEKLSRQGTKVIFVQGNHEFSLEALKWEGVDFVTELDRNFELSCGAKFSVTHGDRFFMNWSYKAYIVITRSNIFKWVSLLLPQRKLDQFALYCSKKSRKHGQDITLDHDKVLDMAVKWLDSTGSEFGLFGHFHFAYDHNFGSKRLLSVNSWYKPNFLAYTNGEFTRVSLRLESVSS